MSNMQDIKQKLDAVDEAILLGFYRSWNHIANYGASLTVRYIGSVVLSQEIGETRSGATVYERIVGNLIPAGVIERSGNVTASPFRITPLGDQYVHSVLSDRIEPVVSSVAS